MKKSAKYIQTWKNNAVFDVRWADVKHVLEEYGFNLREDGSNHWIARNDSLRGHPLFPYGSIGINCHFNGNQGVVHPKAIREILRAIEHLEKEND
jgi:hypothetical protein